VVGSIVLHRRLMWLVHTAHRTVHAGFNDSGTLQRRAMIEGWTHLVRGEQVRRGGVARVAHDVDAQGIPQIALALQRRHQLALHDNAPHTSTFGVFVHVAAAYERCVEVRCDVGGGVHVLVHTLVRGKHSTDGFSFESGRHGRRRQVRTLLAVAWLGSIGTPFSSITCITCGSVEVLRSNPNVHAKICAWLPPVSPEEVT
jgi:hypothetical protein